MNNLDALISLGTLITGGGLVKLIDAGIRWYNMHSKKSLYQNLQAISEAYHAMYNIKNTEEVYRVFLIEISNDGNKPKPGSKLYAKGVEMAISDKIRRLELLKRYEQVQIDLAYINMVIHSCHNPYYAFKTEEEKECVLKTFYQLESIKYSEIYHIYTDDSNKSMYILSVASLLDINTFDDIPGLRPLISTNIEVIRNNFEIYRGTK